MAVPVYGRAAVAVLVGGVPGRGAREAQPQPEAEARYNVPVRIGDQPREETGGGAGRRGTLSADA